MTCKQALSHNKVNTGPLLQILLQAWEREYELVYKILVYVKKMAEKVELPGVFPCMKEYKVNMDSRSLQHGAKWNNSDQCKDLINPTDQSLVLQCSWIHYHFQYSYPWWRFQESWSLSNLSKGLIRAKACLESIPWAPVDLYQTSKVTLESCFRGNYSGGAYDVTLWSGIRGSHA